MQWNVTKCSEVQYNMRWVKVKCSGVRFSFIVDQWRRSILFSSNLKHFEFIVQCLWIEKAHCPFNFYGFYSVWQFSENLVLEQNGDHQAKQLNKTYKAIRFSFVKEQLAAWNNELYRKCHEWKLNDPSSYHKREYREWMPKPYLQI